MKIEIRWQRRLRSQFDTAGRQKAVWTLGEVFQRPCAVKLSRAVELRVQGRCETFPDHDPLHAYLGHSDCNSRDGSCSCCECSITSGTRGGEGRSRGELCPR